MNIFYKAAVAIVLLVVLVSPSFAAKRLALVIGNDIYKNLHSDLHLKKARNDARAVAKTLDGLGFKVTTGFDVDRFGLNQTLDTFSNQIEPGDTAAVFFAGHGVRIEGRNYLLPADVPDVSRTGSQKLLAGESIAVDMIADRLKERGARVAMLILDACRNNPFKNAKGRSVGGARGLASMEPPEGTFILFSAGAGQEALDRLSDDEENPNSVFTRLLVPLLAKEGLEVGRMARLLRQEVKQLAATIGHTQTPAVYNEVTGDFYLLPPKAGQQAETPAPVTSDQETLFWSSVKDSTDPAGLEAYLKQFPNGTFASLAKIRLRTLRRKDAAVIPAITANPPKTPDVVQPQPEPTQRPKSYCYVHDVRPPDDWLALRSRPTGRSGRQLRKLRSGARLEMLGQQRGNWHRVRTDRGEDGWVSWAKRRWIRC